MGVSTPGSQVKPNILSIHRQMLVWRYKRAFSTSNAPNMTLLELNRRLQMGSKTKDLKCVRRTHQKIIIHSLGFDSFLMTKLVQSYADCDDFWYAQKLFDQLPRPNVFAWTAMLALCNRRGLPHDCLQMYGLMKVEGVAPDKYVFPKVLRSCAQLLWLELGMVLHKDAICCGGEYNLQVCNALIDMYSKCGDVGRARKLFNKMGVRDLLTWNSLLSGYVSNGFQNKVLELFDAMKLQGIKPDLISWNTILDAYCRLELCDQALRLFGNISEPNIISWTTMLSGYSRIGKPKMALGLFSKMVQSGCTPDLDSLSTALASSRVVNALTTGREIHAFGMKVNAIPAFYKSCGAALLAMYTASNRCQDVVNVYQLMDKLDVVTWNAMIHGYVDLGSEQKALTCFIDMLNLGIKCDETTLATVLPVCDLKFGTQIHAYISRRRSFSTAVPVWNALIHMYSKCGCVGSAYSLFNGLSVKDTISWNTIINGFGMHGHGHSAIQLLKKMNQSGLCPNSVTFTSVLSACSHSGLVDEGLELFHSLTKDFSFVPQKEHYACIVDLLARCGRVEEAVNFIQTMPFEPDKCIWGSMLAASSAYQNAHVGTLAAEHLFVLEPKHAGHYVTLSNILVRDGKWEEAAQVRRRMEARGLVKPSGYSWVNAEN